MGRVGELVLSVNRDAFWGLWNVGNVLELRDIVKEGGLYGWQGV